MYLSRETILTLSLEIERKGIEFYTAMKKRTPDAFLDYLIEQEHEHIEVFKNLFDRDRGAVRQERFENPHMDDDFLIAAYAETEVFARVDPATAELAELYDIAIAMEKNSIVFYGDLIETLGERFKEEAALVEGIRQEERKHLRDLVEKKRALA